MTPSNTDLREALEQLVWDEGDEPTLINQILALFQAREQQIFTELLGESIWYQEGGSSPKRAVPVEAIEKYREGL